MESIQLNQTFEEDLASEKVDLSVQEYRDEQGKFWVMPVVKKAVKNIAYDSNLSFEYYPTLLGNEEFSNAAIKLLLGEKSPAIKEQRVLGINGPSGTNCLRIGAELLVRELRYSTFYCPQPTWENHHTVFKNAGFKDQKTYRYWKADSKSIDIEGLLQDLQAAPERSVVILQVCGHNPTGCDPTEEQWVRIADLIIMKKLFPFFDLAFQGIVSGDLDRDSWPVRYFVSRGLELLCSQSFGKNFSLHSECVGNLTVVGSNSAMLQPIVSKMNYIIRGMYAGPSAHGSKVIAEILKNEELCLEWKQCIMKMSVRLIQMRNMLYKELIALKTPGNWDHIINQVGMYSYFGLTQDQIKYLKEKYHIYIPETSRISICGLNMNNIQYTARAIKDAVITFPIQ